jgi:hypothetical protein
VVVDRRWHLAHLWLSINASISWNISDHHRTGSNALDECSCDHLLCRKSTCLDEEKARLFG